MVVLKSHVNGGSKSSLSVIYVDELYKYNCVSALVLLEHVENDIDVISDGKENVYLILPPNGIYPDTDPELQSISVAGDGTPVDVVRGALNSADLTLFIHVHV